jgi:hypothetical protein
MNHETIELAFVAIAALALLTQTIILLALYFGVTKAAKSLKEEVDDIRSTVMPFVASAMPVVNSARELVGTTRETLARITPPVEATVADVAELARGLRVQAADIEVSLSQILERVRKQTARVDTMFTGTLDAVDKASVYVTETVSKPIRQLSGMLAGIKAVVESLRATDPARREPSVHDDKDMFV